MSVAHDQGVAADRTSMETVAPDGRTQVLEERTERRMYVSSPEAYSVASQAKNPDVVEGRANELLAEAVRIGTARVIGVPTRKRRIGRARRKSIND